MIKRYQYIIGGLLILLIILISSNIIQAQQQKYWKFQENAGVGKLEQIGETPNGNNVIYRMMDWQTGKVVYIAISPYRWDVSPAISVSNLEHY